MSDVETRDAEPGPIPQPWGYGWSRRSASETSEAPEATEPPAADVRDAEPADLDEPAAQPSPAPPGPSAEFEDVGSVGVAGATATTGGTIAGGDVDQSVRQVVFSDAVFKEIHQLAMARAVVRSSQLDARERRALAGQVVPPPGLETALEPLRDRRVAILAAPQAAQGKWSAAVWLADQLAARSGVPDLRVVRILFGDGVELDARVLEGRRRTVVVADLTEVSADGCDQVRAQLGAFREDLESADCSMVLVIPEHRRVDFEKVTALSPVPLSRPDPIQVFRNRLDATLPPALLAELVRDPELSTALSGHWPRRVASLADAAGAAYRTWGSEADVRVLVRNVLAAAQDWTDELRQAFGGDPAGVRRRTLLLAAALLEGCGAEAVVRAGDLLLKRTHYEWEPPHVLDRAGVSTVLAEELASDDLDPESTRFGRPGFGAAVLRHAWVEHPDLRRFLPGWVAALPGRHLPALSGEAIGDLAGRVVGLASSLDNPRIVVGIATALVGDTVSRGGIDRYRRSVAVSILANGAIDRGIGAAVRAELYEWAYPRNGSRVPLRLTAAEVCGTGFGQAYPDSALVRLKHLAASHADPVREAVVDAVLVIGRHIGMARLLARLQEWLPGARDERRATLLTLVPQVFTEVAMTTDPWAARPADVEPMVGFWSGLIRMTTYDELRPLLDAWLGAVDEGLAVPVLLEAAGDELWLFLKLRYAVDYSGDPSDPGDAGEEDAERLTWGKRALRDRLDERIHVGVAAEEE